MHVLITGGTGFVMSVLARELLTSGAADRLTLLDQTAPDPAVVGFIANTDAVNFDVVDVRDSEHVYRRIHDARPDVVVHGATVTQVPEWERSDPTRYVDVNVLGTSHVLDAARRTDSVRRVLYISSAAVYGSGNCVPGPLSEDAPTRPDEMYGVSKVAAEMVAQRFAALYGLDIPVVRFTMVFGPMERPTSGRAQMSLPFHLAASRVTNTSLEVSERTLRAGGDWISAVDVARALRMLCTDTESCAGTYHLASGERTDVPDLIRAFGASVTTSASSTVDMDPDKKFGKHAIYSIARARGRLGWQPRPLAEQVAEYLSWAAANSKFFHALN